MSTEMESKPRRKSGHCSYEVQWAAIDDGEKCVARLMYPYKIGYWRIDREAFDRLDDDNAWDLIQAGKCVYAYANVRDVGTVVRIFEADWRTVCGWDSRIDVCRDYGDFVEDYTTGMTRSSRGERPLKMPDGEIGRGVSIIV